MRVSSFAEIASEFIERAHRMVWCDMATVGPDGRHKPASSIPSGRVTPPG